MPNSDDEIFSAANANATSAFSAATAPAPSAPPPDDRAAPPDFVGPPAPAEFVGPPAPAEFVGPPAPAEFVGPPAPAEFVGPPTSAQHASDLAAGARTPAAPTDYNQTILDHALSYEARRGGKDQEIRYNYGGSDDATGVDCSHFVDNVLNESGPGHAYQSVSALNPYLGKNPPADGQFERVEAKDVRPGDLVLYSGHVGIVVKPVDEKTGVGSFIGSQGDPDDPKAGDGVDETSFGPKSSYWGKAGRPVTGYLRYKGKGTGDGKSATKGAGAASKAGEGKAAATKAKNEAKKPDAKKVTNNGKEIATKTSAHQCTTTTPCDAHLAVGKGEVKSYDNYSLTSLLSEGSVNTFIDNGMIWLRRTGIVGPTSPEHPDHLPGILKGTYRAIARAVSASLDLFVEGQNAVRQDDKTSQNGGNACGVVKKEPPPAPKAGDAKAEADGKKPCVKLGPNKTFKDAILKASARTGMPPASIASVISAEAAVKKGGGGEWDPDSYNSGSKAQGLTQFLPGTWAGQAIDKSTTLYQKANDLGFLETIETKNKKGKVIKSELRIIPDKRQAVLDLRKDPELSIVSAAEYDVGLVKGFQKKGLIPTDATEDELAKYTYICHHEGPGGATNYFNDTITQEYGAATLPGQVGKVEADKLIAAEGGDAAAAYKKWLTKYTEDHVKPSTYRCKDEAVDGDDAPKVEPPPKPAPKAKAKAKAKA